VRTAKYGLRFKHHSTFRRSDPQNKSQNPRALQLVEDQFKTLFRNGYELLPASRDMAESGIERASKWSCQICAIARGSVAREPLLFRTGWKGLGIDRRLQIKFLKFNMYSQDCRNETTRQGVAESNPFLGRDLFRGSPGFFTK
jgi:hypothetical protein